METWLPKPGLPLLNFEPHPPVDLTNRSFARKEGEDRADWRQRFAWHPGAAGQSATRFPEVASAFAVLRARGGQDGDSGHQKRERRAWFSMFSRMP